MEVKVDFLFELWVEALEQHVSGLAVSEKTDPVEPFVPAHLAYDKKVLKFIGYFKEDFDRSILTAQSENFRIRFVKIYYYLEVSLVYFYTLPVDSI